MAALRGTSQTAGAAANAGRTAAAAVCGVLVAAAAAQAEERFPPPEFSTGYKMPAVASPPPRSPALALLDAGVLLAALLLSTHLVLKRRSRDGVLALAIFSAAYFGFYRKGCVCAIGAIQNLALAAGDKSYAPTLAAIAFFLLPLLFALFVGRVFCAGVCPMGAVQDLVLARPVRVPPWLDHALGLLPYLYLGGAVLFAWTGSAFIICKYDPFISLFRLSGTVTLLSLSAAMLLLSIFVGRPYCRYLCPYGVLLRWAAPWASRRVTITPDTCVQCRLCEDACPYGAIRVPTPEHAPEKRERERRRLGILILLLPTLVVLGGWLGGRSGGTLSRMHASVRLADRVWLEEQGKVQGTTDASDAFRKQGRASEELYREAAALRLRFDKAGILFGAWVGLVFGLKLILLSIRRRRVDYEADPAACVACARCYLSCPQEHLRLGHIVSVEEYQDAATRE